MAGVSKHNSGPGRCSCTALAVTHSGAAPAGAPCLREAQRAAGRARAEQAERRACSRLHRSAAWFLGAPARLAASFAAAFWPDEPSARVATLRCTLCAAGPQRPADACLVVRAPGGTPCSGSTVLGKALRRCWAPRQSPIPTLMIGIVPARPSRVQRGWCLPGGAPRAAGALCRQRDGRQA